MSRKVLLLLTTAVSLLGSFDTVLAQQTPLLGVLAAKNDSFQSALYGHIQTRAVGQGAETFVAVAEDDTTLQMRQLRNLIEARVDAIIVTLVNTRLAEQMITLATDASIPLVFVNRHPGLDRLPPGTALVGSDEQQSGTLQMEELARQAGYKGKVGILSGNPADIAAQKRTDDIVQVVAKYPNMQIVQQATANWERSEATDAVLRWVAQGVNVDIIAANNDEMAIGAIRALEKAGKSTKDILVGGIDATPDGMALLREGKLAATVFQDAKGQGEGAVDVALRLAAGGQADSFNWVPFRLITEPTPP